MFSQVVLGTYPAFIQPYRKCILWVGKKGSIDIQGRISSKVHILQPFWYHCLTYLYHVLLPNQDRIFVESGAPILDLWLVIKCLTSVVKSIQEMQMCRQMGVWTSVEVQCTIARMRVSRRLKSGPVRPSTGMDWKCGQKLKCSSPSVELCNAWHRLVVLKCWSVGEGEKALSPTHARPQDKKSTEAQTDFISHSNAFNLLHCYSTFLNNSEQCSLGSVGVTGWRTDLITRHKTALTPDIAPVIPSLVFDSQIIDINGQGWGESTWPWPSQKSPEKSCKYFRK